MSYWPRNATATGILLHLTGPDFGRTQPMVAPSRRLQPKSIARLQASPECMLDS